MKKQNKTKVVVFDFDGTLGDVIPIMREIYGDFARQKGYPELTEDVYQKLRKGTLKEVLKWMGVRPWQIGGLLREGRSLFYIRSQEVQLFPGVAKLVKELHKEGWDIYILSSNSPKTIKEILARNDIDELVNILKRPPLFGKASSIKALIRAKKYDKSRVWMVGDEVRDIEAANKTGIKSIAVAWGLQHEIAFAKADPTKVALKVPELRKYLLEGE